MVAAIRIDVDGVITVLPDSNYETISNAVGGWIESIPTDGRLTIFVNEEGKLHGLPYNDLGQDIWATVDYYNMTGIDFMAGPCVVTGPVDDEGNTTAVPQWLLDILEIEE